MGVRYKKKKTEGFAYCSAMGNQFIPLYRYVRANFLLVNNLSK